MRNIVIVAHKYLPQPDDDLVFYLNKRKNYRVLHIMHSFPDRLDRKSSYASYVKGKKVREVETYDYKFLPEPLVYLKEAFYTLKWTLTINTKWERYIGMDGLCVFFGLILSKFSLTKIKNLTFWCIEFVPWGRFQSSFKNRVYHFINSLACRNSDQVWDLSPRMAEGRKKYLGINKKDYKLNKVVPYGIWTERIKKVPYVKSQKNTLVFMGHLLPKQGVDTVIKKIPEIAKRIPDFKFKIIGDGRFREALTKLVKEVKVESYCKFVGRIKDSEKLEQEIAKSAVAIAPYRKGRNNYTYFADPGKIKTYLACGVPVLLTDVPWNASEIEKKRCGLIIRGGGEDMVEKLLFLMRPEINREFRKNAIGYSASFNYKNIFSELDI